MAPLSEIMDAHKPGCSSNGAGSMGWEQTRFQRFQEAKMWQGAERIGFDWLPPLLFLIRKHWCSLGRFANIPSLEWCCALAWPFGHLVLLLCFLIVVFPCCTQFKLWLPALCQEDALVVLLGSVQLYQGGKPMAGVPKCHRNTSNNPKSCPSFVVGVLFLLDPVSETATTKVYSQSLW